MPFNVPHTLSGAGTLIVPPPPHTHTHTPNNTVCLEYLSGFELTN